MVDSACMIQIHLCEAAHLPYPDDCFDCLVTDPPYGYGFMGKDWDKVVVPASTWREVFRVMKPGAFGFVMSAPRQDVLARMIVNLQGAGFETGFTSIYWAYATGFPKAGNISKMVDKRLGVEREVIRTEDRRSDYDGRVRTSKAINTNWRESEGRGDVGDVATRIVTSPASPLAKTLDGAYAGFQPKPAVEVILVVMKPLTEKGYLDQAMKDGKGVTWLEAGRIPIEGADKKVLEAKNPHTVKADNAVYGDYSMCKEPWEVPPGRFPANLLVSDDVLDDGELRKCPVTKGVTTSGESFWSPKGRIGFKSGTPDQGTFSRYFDLDVWWEGLPESVRKTFPFLIVPKASKSEKNRGLEGVAPKKSDYRPNDPDENKLQTRLHGSRGNHHPTVKPVKLMSYLIAIGSRPGDLILDPFMGSGTTLVAAKGMGRRAVGVDNDPECIPVAEARVEAVNRGLFSLP